MLQQHKFKHDIVPVDFEEPDGLPIAVCTVLNVHGRAERNVTDFEWELLVRID